MSGSQAGEKSFAATPQRREQFRKEGRYARARDAGGIAASAAVLAALLGSRPEISRTLHLLFARTLGDASALASRGVDEVSSAAGAALVVLAGPAALAAAGAAVAAGVAQAGVRIDFGAIGFDFARFQPLSRLGQVFAPKRGTIEVVLALLRVGFVGYVAYRVLLLETPALLGAASAPLDAGAALVVSAATRVVLAVLGALFGIAAVDYVQSRLMLEMEMKMTRQEVVEESRSQEGDPKQKGRMRARARATLKKRALANVKTADVVVTNPTHVAVALRYGARDASPVVVAKGHDDVALQIRAIARRHGVPILENRALARALDAEVAIGRSIPAAHFTAVARILAFVYRLRDRRGTRRA